MTDGRWLTVEQAAEQIQVHPESIRRWIREGKLAGSLISRRGGYRIRQADLEGFLERRMAPGFAEGKLAA
jgi:excisionase family DNA binding protein